MPAVNPVDPATLDAVAARLARSSAATLDAVAARLTRSSAAALDASHELLSHYADIGDDSTQRTVDTFIDHAADALQSLSYSLSETSRVIETDASKLRGEVALDRGGVSLTRPRLRRGRSA